MKVLLGEFTGHRVARLAELGWGRMWIADDRHVSTYDGEPWGFDNRAFRHWREGTVFEGPAYMRRLTRAVSGGEPYIAIVPDIVAAGERSLRFSGEWVERVRGVEACTYWPWYLAVQDGMDARAVEDELWRYDGLFLGGTNGFKGRTAHEWSALAHQHGKRFHYGRAGTLGKVEHARRVGADSLDSAFPMWTAERWRAFERAVLVGSPQLSIALGAAA